MNEFYNVKFRFEIMNYWNVDLFCYVWDLKCDLGLMLEEFYDLLSFYILLNKVKFIVDDVLNVFLLFDKMFFFVVFFYFRRSL